jgi:hypothetical protein
VGEDHHVTQGKEREVDGVAIGVVLAALFAGLSGAGAGGTRFLGRGRLDGFFGGLGLCVSAARRAGVYDRLVKLTRFGGVGEAFGVVTVAGGKVVEKLV